MCKIQFSKQWQENIAAAQYEIGSSGFSLDDVEDWLNEDSNAVDFRREEECKNLSIKELRMMVVTFVLPMCKFIPCPLLV